MAVEKAVAESALEERGLDKALADNINLDAIDDEDALGTVLDGFTPATPATVEEIEADPTLKALYTKFSDSRVNKAVKSNIAKLKREGKLKTNANTETETEETSTETDETPPWAKNLVDRLDKAEEKQNKADQDKLLKKVAEKEGINDMDLLDGVVIPGDADEAAITVLVKDKIAWLTKHGIKNLGTPGSGGKGIGGSKEAKAVIKGFIDKKKAKAEKLNKK